MRSSTARRPRLHPVPAVKRRLVVVVPAHNEALNVGQVIRELSALEHPELEVDFVIVDDGSRDRTRAVALEAGAEVLSLPYNVGIGVTVQTGFIHAIRKGADLVAQVDGDCQHIPSELPLLYQAIQRGQADMVIGSRFASGQADGLRATTLTRWIGGRILLLCLRVLTGLKISDPTSGFRLYNRKAAELVCQSYADDYPEVEILVQLARAGLRVREIPVRMRARKHGHSSIHGFRPIYYMIKVILGSIARRVD